MQLVIIITAVLSIMLLLFWWYSTWRHQQQIQTVARHELGDVHAVALDNQRSIVLLLPPGYDETAVYPTLYINDGQEEAALNIRESLADLYAAGRIRPLVVVLIPTNDQRLHEYGTAVLPNNMQLGTRAEAYTQFVLHDLMPLVKQHASVSPHPADTAFLGMSLGGLSAFDIVWNHPQRFGIVGVMSGSFWWRSAEDTDEFAPGVLIAHEMVRRAEKRPFCGWFQAATLDEMDDRDNNGVIDAIQDTTELLDELIKLGYERGKEVVYVEVAGGRHDYDTWSRVLPRFLTWAFPASD